MQHIVWFEDARSIDAKLKLVLEYQFPGATVLNVMSLFPQMWMIINAQFEIHRYINKSGKMELQKADFHQLVRYLQTIGIPFPIRYDLRLQKHPI